MSIVVLNSISLLPGKLDEARAAFAELLPDTRGFPGNEGATMHVAQDDPTQLVLVEHWASREDFDAYVAWRKSRPTGRLAGLVAGPASPRVFEELDL